MTCNYFYSDKDNTCLSENRHFVVIPPRITCGSGYGNICTGATGAQGAQGLPGSQGATGATGAIGVT